MKTEEQLQQELKDIEEELAQGFGKLDKMRSAKSRYQLHVYMEGLELIRQTLMWALNKPNHEDRLWKPYEPSN